MTERLQVLRDPDELMAETTVRLHALVGADFSAWNEFLVPEIQPMRFFLRPAVGDVAFSLTEPLIQHLPDHPAFALYRQNIALPDIMQLSDHTPWSRFRESGLYREVYRFLETRFQLTLRLPSPPRVLRLITVNRWQRNFGARDRELLRRLQTVLDLAVQRTHCGLDLEYSLLSAMSTDPHGECIVVRADRSIQTINAAGLRLLQRYSREPVGVDRLPPTLDRWLAGRLGEAAVRRDEASFERRRLDQTVLSQGSQRLVLTLLEDPPLYRLHLRETSNLVEAAHPGWSRVTPRKEEILRWVAEGKTNDEIALILGISAKGVEKHVAELCRFFEVPNRIGLVREYFCR